MLVLLLLPVSCRHHAGSDLVQAPPPPRNCAAWYEIDAPESACLGMDEPRSATMTAIPRLESPHANCMLRCDQSRPCWEVDIRAAGFRGNVVCAIDNGPKLRLSIDPKGVSEGFVHGGSSPLRRQSWPRLAAAATNCDSWRAVSVQLAHDAVGSPTIARVG